MPLNKEMNQSIVLFTLFFCFGTVTKEMENSDFKPAKKFILCLILPIPEESREYIYIYIYIRIVKSYCISTIIWLCNAEDFFFQTIYEFHLTFPI